jgi:two-component system response regulator BaeR
VKPIMTNTTLANEFKILIVEDEPDLARVLQEYLRSAGFQTHILSNGTEAEAWVKTENPNLIILDLMLPGKNGIDICKDIRMHSLIPIIITTAKVEEIDRLLGLELGADDYICKPYSPREVVARVKTVLRRFNSGSVKESDSKTLLIDIDTDKLHLNIGDASIELTQIELNLFRLLYSEPGRIFSRQHILDNIYHDYRIVSDRTVDSHIKKLRKKLHDALPQYELIRSIYGVGYKFEIEMEEK